MEPALMPTWTKGREGGRPLFIVIHHWGIDGQKHENVVRFLATNGNTDIHYVVSAGKRTKLVSEWDTAWHAGDWDANLDSIGIECRPECSTGDFEEVAKLIAELRRRWGWLPLKGHRDIFNTACPGRWYARLDELSRRADAINAELARPKPTPKPSEEEPKKGNQMLMLGLRNGRGNETLWAIFAPGFWLEFTGTDAANRFSRQCINGAGAYICNQGFWDHCKAAALASRVDIDALARKIAEHQKEAQ